MQKVFLVSMASLGCWVVTSGFFIPWKLGAPLWILRTASDLLFEVTGSFSTCWTYDSCRIYMVFGPVRISVVSGIVILMGLVPAVPWWRCCVRQSSKQFYSIYKGYYPVLSIDISSFDSRFEVISLLQHSVEANKKEWLFNLPVSFVSFHSLHLLLVVLFTYLALLQTKLDLSVPQTHKAFRAGQHSSRSIFCYPFRN
jgi:hypothetical protein